jgi:hypothetical protein
MGRSVKFIMRVTNTDDQTVPDAQVKLTLHDASGRRSQTFRLSRKRPGLSH